MINPAKQSGSGDEVPVIPSIEEKTYRELFGLFPWMVSARPWNRMADANCFALIDPITGDHQIAMVMGNAGSFFALHLYQPEEGTRWLTNLHLSAPNDPQCKHDAQFDNHYLEVEFTDGNEMDEHDAELLKRYGEVTGDNASTKRAPHLSCVLLRAVHPGCPPWHLDQGEATRLIDALRLLRRFYEDHFEKFEWAVFMPDEDGSVSLPTFRLPEGANREDAAAWEFGMEKFQSPPPKRLPDVPTDDLFLARLSKFQVKRGARWEQGAIFSPKPTIDQGQPVYPVVGIIGAAETGRAEGLEVASSQTDRATVLRRSLTKTVEDLGYLPEELVVGSPLAELALAEFAERCGVHLHRGDSGMPLFNDIVQDLLSSPLFRSPDDELSPSPLDDISPELLHELEGMMRKASEAGANEADVAKALEQIMENEAGAAILQKFAASMGDGSHFGDLQAMPDSGSPSESQQELLYVPEPVDPDRYVMRIDLLGMKPPIWRRISLPAESTFRDLHLALQAAFDWDDGHLHEFQIRDRNRIMVVVGTRKFDSNACLDETNTKLKRIFTSNVTRMHYVYDFGDSWTHLIKIEKKIPPKPGQTGPECHAGRGIAPLEDCGGI